MPISKSKRKINRPRKSTPVITNRRLRAGAEKAFQAIHQLLQSAGTGGGEIDMEGEVHIQGFFLGYHRVCRNAGIEYDVQPAVAVLDKICTSQQVTYFDLKTLKAKADELWSKAKTVRDWRIWQEALTDLELYCIQNGYKWVGIGDGDHD